jgi:hypothetical protein
MQEELLFPVRLRVIARAEIENNASLAFTAPSLRTIVYYPSRVS